MSRNPTYKYDIVRVVTVPESVTFHLNEFLRRVDDTLKVAVVGAGVEQCKNMYPHIDFYNIEIPRNISVTKDTLALLQLIKFFKNNSTRIVHSIMPKAGLLSAVASYVARVPFRIHTFTGQVWATKTGLYRRFLKTLDKVVVALNTHCFTDSSSQSKFLLNEGVGIKGQPIPVLGQGSLSGVNYEKFNPELHQAFKAQFYESHHISEKEFVFLFIGRKCKDKGVFDLLNAFKSIDQNLYPCRLVMVGPNEDPQYQELSKQFDHTIIEIGMVKDPEKYFSSADAFCIFSYREGFGTVAIEAAAAKLPVLGTKIPGLVDAIVDGETGLLVAVGHVSDIKNALLKVLNDRQLSLKMGQAGQLRAAQQFSSEIVFKHLMSFYKELMKN